MLPVCVEERRGRDYLVVLGVRDLVAGSPGAGAESAVSALAADVGVFSSGVEVASGGSGLSFTLCLVDLVLFFIIAAAWGLVAAAGKGLVCLVLNRDVAACHWCAFLGYLLHNKVKGLVNKRLESFLASRNLTCFCSLVCCSLACS